MVPLSSLSFECFLSLSEAFNVSTEKSGGDNLMGFLCRSVFVLQAAWRIFSLPPIFDSLNKMSLGEGFFVLI